MTTQNLLKLFTETVARQGQAPCFRYKEKGAWHTLSWFEVQEKAAALAGALERFGVAAGDRVAIFSRTRYEWTLADLAILATGAASVPIYESSTREQAAYILNDSEARVLLIENPTQLEKILQQSAELKFLRQIILIEGKKPKADRWQGIYTLEEALLLGAKEGNKILAKAAQTLEPDTIASIVYTSGTTGPPKGAILAHRCFLAEIAAVKSIFSLTPDIEALIFLPLAHIFARVLQFFQFECGHVQNYAESIDKLIDNIAEVRPHMMGSVPRIFEKVHERVLAGVEIASARKKKIFHWAMDVGTRRLNLLAQDQTVPFDLSCQFWLADKLVFSKLKKRLGGRVKFFVSGGAPLAKEIAQFFLASGIVILEGYGLTETTAAITCNSLKHLRLGTVGKPVSGVQIKLADDGEILVRGDVVFKGYFKQPEATQAALDSDGWFRTGDIGAFDGQGFLRITDRKKDIIITAAGKNVAPQNIENFIKTDPMISQIMVHGDRRKFLSALITLNQDEIVRYARSHAIPYKDFDDLVHHERIYSLLKARIEEKNKQLAKYETIKKFAILAKDFSVETGELTPTLKIKRKFTSTKYQDILDAFYQEHQESCESS